MVKVKPICCKTCDDLERETNIALEAVQSKGADIVDVKFSVEGTFTALIIYNIYE